MWQRIQTLWLALVVVLMCLLLVLPMVAFVDRVSGIAVHQMTAWGIEDMSGALVGVSWPVGVLTIVVASLAFVSLFLYKGSRGRAYQVRISVLSSLILFGMLGYMGVITHQHCIVTGLSFGAKFALALPLVALVLEYLAIRSILKDEMLVRLSNRLR